ncbi:MAG: serine aminopeptidase domain-containing protein, partial [Saprospiraceae bacterium]
MKTEIPVEISPKIKNVLHLFSSDKTESIMLIVPALGVKARYYFDFCQRIVELLDVSAAVMDWRGNGDSSLRVSRGNNWGMKELIEDVNFTIDWLQEKYPNKKINILGHS